MPLLSGKGLIVTVNWLIVFLLAEECELLELQQLLDTITHWYLPFCQTKQKNDQSVSTYDIVTVDRLLY